MSSNIIKPDILFIDDEPEVLARLKYIFEESYTCYFADTGKLGLELYETLKPSMVVCDVNLPDISGIDICREIKKQSLNTCVILLSAYNDEETHIKGLEALANNYIDKSLSGTEIFLRVRNLHPQFVENAICDNSQIKNDLKKRLYKAFAQIYLNSQMTRKEVTVKKIAKEMAMSDRSLQRKLNRETGISFSEHHSNYRLERSKSLLQQGYSSTDTASMLNYSSPSHFSKNFKKKFGMTPSNYFGSCQVPIHRL